MFWDKGVFFPVYSFYVNRLDKLYLFINNFKISCRYVLNKLYNSPLVYPTKAGETTPLSSPEWRSIYNGSRCLGNVDRLTNLVKKYRLTPKELIVASHLISGCSQKEVASLLNLSPRTVEKHVVHLKEKTGSRSIIHLMSNLMKNSK